MPHARTAPVLCSAPLSQLALTVWALYSNYTVSVFDMYQQINSPTVRQPSLAQLQNGITSPKGDPNLWVDYLATGELQNAPP